MATFTVGGRASRPSAASGTRARSLPRARPGRIGPLSRLGPVGLAAFLIGCSALPAAPGSALAQDGDAGGEPGSNVGRPTAAELAELRRELEGPEGAPDASQTMFEILVAELAGRRGRLDVALEGYLLATERSDDPRVADRAARLAVFARDWDRAARATARWLALAPGAPGALELAGQIELRRGDGEAAAARFADLVDASDDADDSLDRIGALLLSDPDAGLASDVADRLETRFADSAAAALAVAQLALARGEQAPARAALDRALALEPADAGALLLSARLAAVEGDVDGALARLDVAVQASPEDRRLRLGRAQLLVEAGRTDAARSALADIARRLDAGGAPDDGLLDEDLRLSVAQLALQAGLLEDAESGFVELVDSPVHADLARFQLGRLRDTANDPDAAIELYEAVAPSEWFVTAQVRAAELRADRGEIEVATTRLRDLRANVEDPEVQPRLITAQGRIMQDAGDATGALALLGEGVDRFPDDSELRYARALAADAAGQPELLVSDLEALIVAEPDNAHALNALGYHFAERDVRLDDAERYLERAVQLRDADPAILDSLGWLRYRQGRRDEAVELLQRAYTALPDPEIAAHLGEVLWVGGREAEAREVWETALAAAPGDEALGRVMKRFVD